VTAQSYEFEYASDYVAFLEADIPSAGLLSGAAEPKTEKQAAQWGGQAGAPFDSCYHTACDRLDNVDSVALTRYSDAVAGTVAHFALSETDPGE
jgi:aminopeptidase S